MRSPALALFGLLVAAIPGPALAQVPVFDPHGAVDPAAVKDTHRDEFPRIAAGQGGVWVLVWQVTGAADLGLGRDVDVVFARSSNDGATWSAPKPLSETFAGDRAEDRQASIATDGKGTWMAVWSSTADVEGGTRRDRDIHFTVSTDNALSWSPPRALNSNASKDWGDDGSPDVAVDATGRWVAVWESSDTLGSTKGGDRDILFATSTDTGKTWTAPDVVDAGARSDMAFDASPRVAADAMGTWLVAWSSGGAAEDREGFQRGVLLSRSEDGAATWSPPQALAGESEDDRPDFGPRLAGDGRGRWICAWSSSDSLGDTIGRDRDLLLVRSDDGGRTWTKRAPLNREAAEDSGDDDTPELAVDGAGNWVAVWPSWDRRGASRGADADLLVAMSRDHGATWTPSATLNSNAKTDHGEDISPALATDGAGVWIAAWSSTETAGEVLGLDRDIQAAVGRFGREIAGPPPPGN
jgi:hypothetical protein